MADRGQPSVIKKSVLGPESNAGENPSPEDGARRKRVFWKTARAVSDKRKFKTLLPEVGARCTRFNFQNFQNGT